MASYHVRSISLPTKPHPIAEQFEAQLCRLRSSQAASTSASSSVSILVDLYGSVDQLLLLQVNQQAVAQHCRDNQADGLLDGSLRLLDICSTVRDALLQMRESLQDIQSVLRRRYSGELNIDKELNECMLIRKKVKQAIKSCLKEIQKVDKIDEASSVISMLRDVEAITVTVFKSLLINIAGTQPKKSSWCLMGKLAKADEEAADFTSTFENLDAALSSFKKKSGFNMVLLENLTSQMLIVESEIQDLDEALESLFRCMVKSRATLLNILSY